jgi:hypothetical protein
MGVGINGYARRVQAKTRRELGAWPSADRLLEQLRRGVECRGCRRTRAREENASSRGRGRPLRHLDAAETPEERTKLEKLRDAALGVGHDALLEMLKMLARGGVHHIPM